MLPKLNNQKLKNCCGIADFCCVIVHNHVIVLRPVGDFFILQCDPEEGTMTAPAVKKALAELTTVELLKR